MNVFYLVLGIIILVTCVLDMLWTILWVEGGGGPLTRRLTAAAWKSLRKITGGHSKALSIAGPFTIILTLLTWIILLWGGWTLVFGSGDAPLADTQNRGALVWSDIIYFTGYTLFTLGIGDFVPINSGWQIATILASASGMLLITMSASYIISILSAVNQKRSFADSIIGLGNTGKSIVEKSWNGKNFGNIDLFLITYIAQLSTITTQHKAYPVLHYYHCKESSKALNVGVAVLDEALTIFQFGFDEGNRPNSVILKNARSTVQSYLDTQASAYVKPADQAPPVPDLAALRNKGMPVVSDEKFKRSLVDLEERRKKLLGLIHSDERKWQGDEIK